jgi:hypothetical protein
MKRYRHSNNNINKDDDSGSTGTIFSERELVRCHTTAIMCIAFSDFLIVDTKQIASSSTQAGAP